MDFGVGSSRQPLQAAFVERGIIKVYAVYEEVTFDVFDSAFNLAFAFGI